MKGDRYKLDQWELCPDAITGAYLTGLVTGHSRFKDGEQIHTTRLIGCEGSLALTRSGSLIELGEPHPNYEKEFPNARARLLSELKRGETLDG